MDNKKTIILALPENAGLSNLIAKNFEHYGFDVIYYQRKPYKYKNLIEKIANFFRKNLFGKNNYKIKKQDKEAFESLQLELIKRNQKVDYALFIRPDKFSIDFIRSISSYANRSIGYQWDGLNRFPNIFDRIELFDDFYVFDCKDIQKHPEYNLKYTTNFYFDMDANPTVKDTNNKNEIYFIGTHLTQRVHIINNFLRSVDNLDLKTNFIINLKTQNKIRKSAYEGNYINFVSKNISYSENLANVKNSDILIDFVNNIHSGLSFRFFESVFYQKKLITDNTEIINYDLYHEDNIYVWDGGDLDINSVKHFLSKPYYDLSPDIVKKYSFEAWYKLILDIN